MGEQYVSAAELRTYVNQFATQEISDPDLTNACSAASSKADSYLRGRYPLPLLSFGDDIKMHTAWIGVYIALRARGYNPANEGETDPIRDQYNDAVAWFEGVQRQAIHPDVSTKPLNPPGGSYSLPSVRSARPRGW